LAALKLGILWPLSRRRWYFNFVFLLHGLLGGRTLTALLTGRYHQPRSEARLVLFLDLCGSLEPGERLGDEGIHRFLNRVFFDLTYPVLSALSCSAR